MTVDSIDNLSAFTWLKRLSNRIQPIINIPSLYKSAF